MGKWAICELVHICSVRKNLFISQLELRRTFSRPVTGGISGPMSISRLSNSEFVSKVIQDSEAGRSFIPLIGSGLSSPSGIIMGMEFTNYLAFATYLVLSDPKQRERTHGEGHPEHWDLRHQGWPPLPSDAEVKSARKWLLAEFKTICDRYGLDINYDDDADQKKIRSLTPRLAHPASHEVLASLVHPQVPSILASNDLARPDESVRRVADLLLRRVADGVRSSSAAAELLSSDSTRSYRERLVETGIRSLHDWRETLAFLASVEVQPSGLVYGAPMNSVIDRFNSFITRDKQPNLGHKMLAHLSGPMRIHAILTTNFDTLIEDAFRSLLLRVRILPVSSKGQLPEPQTVGADFSVVKLHGEVQDTRADMTLDDEPSDEDKATFVAYLTRGAGHLRRQPPERQESKRLLVIGYSGADHRCVQMIKHWLEKGLERSPGGGRSAPGQIVYWVCFSESDVAKVQRLFQATEYKDRIRVTQTPRPDLLLYELYQRLVLSLPPGGLTYEFSHVVPPRRLRLFDYSADQIRNVLACSKTVEHPLEAARVLLSEAASLDDARRLCRDAAVEELKCLVLDAVHGRLKFYDQNDLYTPITQEQCVATLWSPTYRDEKLIPSNQASDPQKIYEHFEFRPIMIDAVGGVVRGVAEAVAELTATTMKKVFWVETQDYMDADAMLRDILRSLAVRCGSFQGRQVTQHPLDANLGQPEENWKKAEDWKNAASQIGTHLKRVLADYRLDAHEIVILIYGRDSYGGCAGLIPSLWGCREKAGKEQVKQLMRPLHCVIEGLGLAGLQTIYFPLTEPRAKRKSQFPSSEKPKNPAAKAEHEHGRTWQMPTPPDSKDWAKWIEDRDSFEYWRVWPSDPFASEVITPERASDSSSSDSRVLLNHCDADATSVFLGIVEHVLEPYFEFQHSKNKDHPLRRAWQRPFECTRDVERKLVFLYALTLFRHSRHVNALCSEGAYQCPYRSNAKVIDNDFVRSEEIVRWIDDLRRARIFLDKPGGSVWMHRDIRLTLRYFLEHLDLQNVSKAEAASSDSSKDSSDQEPRNRFLMEVRSRLHFWIGDWYHKAFCSSGHLTPILESIHHRIMAALYAPFARFKADTQSEQDPKKRAESEKGVSDYRMLLFESSLIEAQKTVYIAWKSLKLWQPSPQEVSWIGAKHRGEISECINAAIKDLVAGCQDPVSKDAYRERLDRATNGLINALKAISQELLLEGGGGGVGPEDTTTSLRYSPLNSGLSAFDHGAQQRDNSGGNAPQVRLDPGWQTINKPQNEFKTHVEMAFEDQCLDGADLLGSITEVSGHQSSNFKGSNEAVRTLSQKKATWKSKYAHQPQRLHDMIWLLGEYAYLMLRRAKVLYHARRQIEFGIWIQATAACNLGIDFCKHLPAWLLPFDIQSKVKLHSLYGVSLANIGRFFEATRHFNEAQALLSKMPDASRSDLAVIMLRRAEALITECLWIGMFIAECQWRMPGDKSQVAYDKDAPPAGDHKAGPTPAQPCSNTHGDAPLPTGKRLTLLGSDVRFELISGELNAETWSASVVENALRDTEAIAVPPRISEIIRKSKPSERVGNDNTVRSKWAENAHRELVRLYKSVLDEAVALLDLAEHNLSGHSQSSLWWSRLHTLRLRAYGLLPPLGDAASDSLLLRKTSAEQGIFESHRNALRIARSDPFRRLRTAKYFFDADWWLRGHESKPDLLEPGSQNVPATRLPESYKDSFDTLFSLYDKPHPQLTWPPELKELLRNPEELDRRAALPELGEEEDGSLQTAIAVTIFELRKRDWQFKKRWDEKVAAEPKPKPQPTRMRPTSKPRPTDA